MALPINSAAIPGTSLNSPAVIRPISWSTRPDEDEGTMKCRAFETPLKREDAHPCSFSLLPGDPIMEQEKYALVYFSKTDQSLWCTCFRSCNRVMHRCPSKTQRYRDHEKR